jgi:geranylgeranyl diphosphate synthase type II
MSFDLTAWSAPRLRLVEARLADCFADVDPPDWREALLYPLQTGGKRIRPLICLAAAEALAGEAEALAEGRMDRPLRAAVALELVHTYSLVHDDLPSMDDDDERRGRPTVHKVYGEAVAILVGDALLTEAFRHVEGRMAEELAAAAGARGMVGGQFLDIRNVSHDLAALRRLHRQKTGALIGASAVLGGLSVRLGAGPGASAAEILADYGAAVGLAFQLADDVLDAEQDAGEGGPPSFLRWMGRHEVRAEAERLVAHAVREARRLPHPDALVALARFSVERSV